MPSPYLIQVLWSGYDIACAQNNTPIIYQILKPTVKPVSFVLLSLKNIYFVYLNKKKQTAKLP
jgi:hypothetical protein